MPLLLHLNLLQLEHLALILEYHQLHPHIHLIYQMQAQQQEVLLQQALKQ